MGIGWRREGESKRGLQREVELPLPNTRRPCFLVAACMAVLFMTASIDAALWQANAERETVQSESSVFQRQSVSLAIQLNEARAQIAHLQAELTRLRLETKARARADVPAGTLRRRLHRALPAKVKMRKRGHMRQPKPTDCYYPPDDWQPLDRLGE